MNRSRLRRIIAIALGGLILLACPARREEKLPADVPVFLISVDTLRSDHVGAYGSKSGSTPNIDRFAKDAIVYEHAFSHVPQTLPSHATILTGLLPQTSGVRDNIGYVVPESVPTLPSLLKENGYATGAAVSSYVLRRATGISRGFDSFDDELEYKSALDTNAERNGERTLAALERWLDGAASSKKVFGFLHLYEPHAPYTPPPEFAKGRSPYDGEVAYADAIVGHFLDDLKRRGLYDDALIVFLSDHGEGLGDHGEEEHGIFLYREAIQVPLIVKVPRGANAGTRVPRLAALTDVMPSILETLGIASRAKLDGISLFGARKDGRRLYAESYYARLHLHWHELTSLVTDDWHYIDAPRLELYAWPADPAESRNVAEPNRRTAFALQHELAAMIKPFQPPSHVDLEDQRKLAALGYIGSIATGGGDYPDPKDHIQYIRLFHQADSLMTAHKYAEALPLLVRLTRENPSLVEEWLFLADAQAQTGHATEAMSTLREAIKRFPGHPNATLTLALLLMRAGRYSEAAAHAELALKQDAVLARETLAMIAMTRGNLAEAREQIDIAIGLAPHRTTTLMALETIQRKQSDWSGALATLDRVADEVTARHLPPIRGMESDRGEALLHLQRSEEAAAAFRKETELFPDDLPAWGNLAVILAVEGRRNEAIQTLRDAMQKNPGKAARQMAIESLDAIGEKESAQRLAKGGTL
ncbi:MAG TPA: sulfatase-like hydrolase/transferase [Thermoanaerobaculia bacterium]|nr:sulfatase-like hydrolase/transferase [Thermoanaerobaculia bacterium]